VMHLRGLVVIGCEDKGKLDGDGWRNGLSQARRFPIRVYEPEPQSEKDLKSEFPGGLSKGSAGLARIAFLSGSKFAMVFEVFQCGL
jgi:hypothetical protein